MSISDFSTEVESSFAAFSGLSRVDSDICSSAGPITSLPSLICALDAVFRAVDVEAVVAGGGGEGRSQDGFEETTRPRLAEILRRLNLDDEEIAILPYTHWSDRVPYTRNLIHTDGKHYSLLLLCWNAKTASKIHDHPVQGCFVLPIRGSIVETLYTRNGESSSSCGSCGVGSGSDNSSSSSSSSSSSESNGDIGNTLVETKAIRRSKGDLSFMSNASGLLHKISNDQEQGAISLHLYTPPFSRCQVWPNGVSSKESITADMVFYSAHGKHPLDDKEFDLEFYI